MEITLTRAAIVTPIGPGEAPVYIPSLGWERIEPAAYWAAFTTIIPARLQTYRAPFESCGEATWIVHILDLHEGRASGIIALHRPGHDAGEPLFFRFFSSSTTN